MVPNISDSTLVIIPTYNEAENLPLIVDRLQQAQPTAHVLVVDDGSPDGTGDIADKLAINDHAGRIHVMHRTQKNGLGAAYIAGFRWGLEQDYQVLVEMDADGSHAPEELHRLLHAVDGGADLAIGSRYVPGGTTVNWPMSRQLISRVGNLYVRLALGTRIRDLTGGFRAYRREALAALDLDAVESRGYGFQVDLGWRLLRAGRKLVEVPITFTERAIGESKMSTAIVAEAMGKVFTWGREERLRQLREFRKSRRGASPSAGPTAP
ncbi:polyprenol monophosphomannose synthase [Skermania piniformis]|uniref:Polyprenol monophosphomannose synthase n=1 Tax=Skermania pinensis TaxID=39122 RepID=A0ABX8SFS7_9ACTN|nr:polyprenol monophosphomannose synthase [Skermania piniformis]